MGTMPSPKSEVATSPQARASTAGGEPEPAHELPRPTPCQIAAWAIMAGGLLLVLQLRLLASLLCGLLVYQLVHLAVPVLQRRLSRPRARVVAVTIVAMFAAGIVVGLGVGLVALFRSGDHISHVLERMADSANRARGNLPVWVADYLPTDADDLRDFVVRWLRDHARDLRTAGSDFGRVVAHVLVGLVIGAMVCLLDVGPLKNERPLAHALRERVALLGSAFRRVVFAQVRISTINAGLTALFLLVALPAFGAHMPLAPSLVVLTFAVGIIPVVGNLISNTAIVIVGLSVSLYVGLAALGFLLVIHKLEYFLNARIVGSRISARAWELLAAMLVLEAAFGFSGVIAAPIYYAYLKDEMTTQGLV